MKSSNGKLSSLIGRVGLHTSAWIAIIYMTIPLLVIIAVSFNGSSRLAFPPEGLTIDWYRKFLSDPSYLSSIIVSVELAVYATLIALVLGVAVSIAIARGKIPGASLLSTLMMSPLILPNIVIGAALLQFASTLGLARTFGVLLAGHVVLVIPYVVRLVLASFAGINQSLEEASADLGAGAVYTFFFVTLPQIKSGIVAGALFAFVTSFVNVELSIFNTSPSLSLLPIKIYNYVQYTVDPLIAAASASTIYVAIIIVLLIDVFVGIDRFANMRS